MSQHLEHFNFSKLPLEGHINIHQRQVKDLITGLPVHTLTGS